MTRIDAETLLPNDHLRRGALDGAVTQVHRGDRYADEGDAFELEGTAFEVTAVEERTLGDLTDEDARAEGAESLDDYRERLGRVHDGVEWDDDSTVVRHVVERRE